MILASPVPGIVAYSAEPMWLDCLMDALGEADLADAAASPGGGGEREEAAGAWNSEPEVRVTARELAALRTDILDSGYIGADGRVLLFFSDEAWRVYQAVIARVPHIERSSKPKCRHFGRLAAARA